MASSRVNFSLRFLPLLLFICSYCAVNGQVIELDEHNWNAMIDGEWMVEFFAPWCPACKALTPVWKEFAGWGQDLGIKVAQVDVTNNPGLSGRFMVTALPTIYHVKDGVFRQYRGSRDKDSFMSFVEEKKWQSLEPIPGWKTPQSYQMSAVSYFFKLSMSLRSIHTHLVDEMGLPYWASYLLFALATVVLGAILGLIVVCVIDLVFPPSQNNGTPPTIGASVTQQGKTEHKNSINKIEEEEEELEENIIDDTQEEDESNQNNDVRKRKVENKKE